MKIKITRKQATELARKVKEALENQPDARPTIYLYDGKDIRFTAGINGIVPQVYNDKARFLLTSNTLTEWSKHSTQGMLAALIYDYIKGL